MITRLDCSPALPATSFSFSIIVTSPIRQNLMYNPVGAIIFPIASVDVPFASLIIAGLDILMAFLFKRSLAHPPDLCNTSPETYPVTLSMPQLTQLIQATLDGQVPLPAIDQTPGQGFGPVGVDQPLFPDNLSVSLFVATSFAPFDGSPDTSFTVPLFEVPGVPGNLIIALGLFTAQFLIERAGIGTPDGT